MTILAGLGCLAVTDTLNLDWLLELIASLAFVAYAFDGQTTEDK